MSKRKPHYCDGKSRKAPYEGGQCPRCLEPLPKGYPGAISRHDNKTEICSACGLMEAIEGVKL